MTSSQQSDGPGVRTHRRRAAARRSTPRCSRPPASCFSTVSRSRSPGRRLEEAPRISRRSFRRSARRARAAASAASLLGLNARLGTVQAALVNGAAMHVLDFEPMWLPATHALSPVARAGLALGEALGASGAKILAAMVLGIEIQGRLRLAAGTLESHELTFHPPGFVGPIGAAVAAGHLLDFDADQFANAIGIAGSRCGGLFVNLGTMTKATHCAYAAALGLEAALLTRRGFTGCPTLFDPAPQSYAEAFFPHGLSAEALLDFGQPFRIDDPGYAIKIFPGEILHPLRDHRGPDGAAAHPVARCDPQRADHRRRCAVERSAPSAQRSRRQIQPAIHRRRGAARWPCRPCELHRRTAGARTTCSRCCEKIEVTALPRHS